MPATSTYRASTPATAASVSRMIPKILAMRFMTRPPMLTYVNISNEVDKCQHRNHDRLDMPKRKAYHHGDLRRALLDATLTLAAEHGAARVTLREAARA